MVLDVQGGTMKSGTNVQQYTSNNTSAQKWKFYNAGNGYYYIGCGNFALDVSGGNSSNGTNIQIYSPNSTKSQAWKLIKIASPKAKSSYTAFTDSGNCCMVKIDSSLINKSGKQNATVKLKTYNSVNNKSTNGKVVVTLKDTAGNTIWSGVKSGGDTIKLGDDYPVYKIYVTSYDSGSGVIADGNDFINLGKTGKWGITDVKNGQLYSLN